VKNYKLINNDSVTWSCFSYRKNPANVGTYICDRKSLQVVRCISAHRKDETSSI